MNRAGKAAVPRRPRDCDDAFFNWLPQHLENVAAELEHLVEKQQRRGAPGSPRPGRGCEAAADQRDVGNRVDAAPRTAGSSSDRCPSQQAATECTAVTSSASSNTVSGGSTPPTRRAIIVFRRRWTNEEQVCWPPADAIVERAARQELPADIGEIGDLAGGSRRSRRDVLRRRHRIVQGAHRFSERRGLETRRARKRSRLSALAFWRGQARCPRDPRAEQRRRSQDARVA